jgi:hypothetical protein
MQFAEGHLLDKKKMEFIRTKGEAVSFGLDHLNTRFELFDNQINLAPEMAIKQSINTTNDLFHQVPF